MLQKRANQAKPTNPAFLLRPSSLYTEDTDGTMIDIVNFH